MPRAPRGRHASKRTYLRRRVVTGFVAAAVLIGVVLIATSLIGFSPKSKGSEKATTSTTVVHTTTTKATNPVTMTFVGDTMLGNTPNLPGNAASYFGSVASALNAPTVFGNLEGTLTDSTGGSKCGASSTNCYAFRNPVAYAPILKSAGFTVLNSANNHSHDYGSQGLSDTTTALQSAGIVQAGLPGQIGLTTQGSTKIAFVDFAPYSNTNNMLDLATAKTLIAQAKAEADVVVVYMHVGAEGASATHVTGQEETYVGEDRGNAKVFAHAAIDDGANLVVASGPHVLRGMEYYNGILINYSLANFAGYQNFATSGTMDLSGILRVTLSGNGSFQSAHFTSVAATGDGQPTIDGSGAASSLVNQLSQADFGPSAAIIQPNGDLAPPPAVP